MIYASLWLYQLLGHNFALAITVLTIAVRLLTLPLTLPAQKSIQALQKKYAKDKERPAPHPIADHHGLLPVHC